MRSKMPPMSAEELYELNLKQAAKIMRLEVELAFAKRQIEFHVKRWEELKPEFKANLGLRGSKWVRHE